ncbi:MAG TPA: hypothetical protein VMZ53_01035 [Kofleriaceae bacterium]|nr:hypothetical protein [Kofleriaceae bacterium]
MRLAVVVVLATGCRFNFFESDPPRMDVGTSMTDADTNIELGPWGTPVLMTDVSLQVEPDDDPTLTADELEIYFDSGRVVTGGAGGDVWMATRASTADPFNTPTNVTELLSGSDDSTGDLSADGLRLYLSSDRRVTGDRDLYVSSRADRQSAWGTLVRIAELSATSQNDAGACESSDGLSLIFGSERSGNGDLFVTTRVSTGAPWSLPQLVPGINTAEEESQHWCNGELTLIYFSRRNATSGDLDIFYASRANPSVPFDPARRVDELTTSGDDADPWVSSDLRTMYFSRGATGGDIFISKR